MVSSTKPASFSVSVWMATCTSCSSATASAVSIAAGVVPQSSCSLRPTAPASTCSRSGPGAEALPLPSRPRLTGNSSIASSIRWMFHTPGVHVVAAVPVAGPVPPPSSVVSPALIASVTICGQMKWMCVSSPPGVTILPSPAMTSVPAPTTMPLVTPAMIARGRAIEVGVLPARQSQGHCGAFCRGIREAGSGRGWPGLGTGDSAPAVEALQSLLLGPAGGEAVQAVDLARARQLDQRHALGVAGLEPHGGARRHVQPHAEHLGAIEPQRAVHLEEVEVRADLDRPVPRVLDGQLEGPPSDVRLDVAALEQVLPWNHRGLLGLGIGPISSGEQRRGRRRRSRASSRPDGR